LTSRRNPGHLFAGKTVADEKRTLQVLAVKDGDDITWIL
jgi:hypothetical protein